MLLGAEQLVLIHSFIEAFRDNAMTLHCAPRAHSVHFSLKLSLKVRSVPEAYIC
jgi:hypothetical protein